ncbi:hypothetical protein SGLAM104S_05394 [Streptomyces glaucescens]
MRLPRSVRDINQASKGEFVEKEDLYAKDVSAVQWRKSSRSIFACVEVCPGERRTERSNR